MTVDKEAILFFKRCADSNDYRDIYNDPSAVFTTLLEYLNKSSQAQRPKFVHKVTGFEIFRDETRRKPPPGLTRGDLAKYIGRKWKRFKQDVRDEYMRSALTKQA